MKKIMFNDSFGLTQAVLEGRKTQTRRVIICPREFKGEWVAGFNIHVRTSDRRIIGYPCMYDADECEFDEGEILPKYRVNETVAVAQAYHDCGGLNEKGVPRWDIIAQAVGATGAGWDNKMFVRADLMPYQIHITNVRIERLQDISDEDCLKEGLEWDGVAFQYYVNYKKETAHKTFLGKTPREAFARLIDKISGKGTWESNPYIWVYDFELVK